jgi:hypothetical protein
LIEIAVSRVVVRSGQEDSFSKEGTPTLQIYNPVSKVGQPAVEGKVAAVVMTGKVETRRR